MASYIRKKEALRGATYAFLAGAHRVTEEVERQQSITFIDEDGEDGSKEDRRTMLAENYARVTGSPDVAEYFCAILNEEELYPFGAKWSVDALREVFEKTIAPELEGEVKFRFRSGYKKILSMAAELDDDKSKPHTTDHWLVQLLNIAFHSGMNIAAQCAENAEPYYEAMAEIENDEEPWGHYPQIVAIFERQLRRETKRKTGLVTTFDD